MYMNKRSKSEQRMIDYFFWENKIGEDKQVERLGFNSLQAFRVWRSRNKKKIAELRNQPRFQQGEVDKIRNDNQLSNSDTIHSQNDNQDSHGADINDNSNKNDNQNDNLIIDNKSDNPSRYDLINSLVKQYDRQMKIPSVDKIVRFLNENPDHMSFKYLIENKHLKKNQALARTILEVVRDMQ